MGGGVLGELEVGSHELTLQVADGPGRPAHPTGGRWARKTSSPYRWQMGQEDKLMLCCIGQALGQQALFVHEDLEVLGGLAQRHKL